MYIGDIKQPSYFTIDMQCDECPAKYKAKIRTILKQESVVGHHQCRKCSSRRAGKKTGAKMAAVYSTLYSGDGNPSKKPGVGKKISDAKSGVAFTDEHKKALCKPKSKTDKIIEAANRPEERERRRLRAIARMTDPARVGLCPKCGFANFDTGWVKTEKTVAEIWCRSGLEKYFLREATKLDCIELIESAEYLRIPYMLEDKKHVYLPDFKLLLKSGEILIVEVKGSFFSKMADAEPKRNVLEIFCKEQGWSCVSITEKEVDKWLTWLAAKSC